MAAVSVKMSVLTTETGRLRIQRHATKVTWLCLSNQKGELTWSHPFLTSGFVVRASEWSEFSYSARTLRSKELSSIDFARTKISPFWLTENTIMHLTSFGLSLAYQTLRNMTAWVHLFGLTNEATWLELLTSGARKITVTRISEFAVSLYRSPDHID